MDELLRVVLLGIIEGITEFLPISSTGHLIIGEQFLPLRESLQGTFEVFIQIGAVVAVIAYYRVQLLGQAQGVYQAATRDQQTTRRWIALVVVTILGGIGVITGLILDRTTIIVIAVAPVILLGGVEIWIQTRRKTEDAIQILLGVMIAFVPAALFGFLLDDWINDVLFSPIVVGVGLIAGGILFLLVERFLGSEENIKPAKDVNDDPLTLRQALIVGLWQVLALIPGMSRSGMSIIGGMLAGLDRRRATDFSFYLALPTLGIATIYALLRDIKHLDPNDLGLLFVGAVVSGIVAWLSIGWLLRYISTNNFIPFGIYRILAGVIIILIFSS